MEETFVEKVLYYVSLGAIIYVACYIGWKYYKYRTDK